MIPANCAPNGGEVHVTYILPQSEQMFKAIGHPGPWALRHGHHSLLSPGRVPRPRSSKGNCSPPLGEPLLRNPAVQSPRPYREEQVVPGGSREGLGSRASSHLWGKGPQAARCSQLGGMPPYPACTVPSSHCRASESRSWPCTQPCEGRKARDWVGLLPAHLAESPPPGSRPLALLRA